MAAELTKEVLVDACKKNGGYSQPHLNDQLFLQYKGYTKIQNLEPYVDLKVLWLEQNGIEHIEGLSGQKKLVSLFLQNNIIRKIGTGLEQLTNLRILNLSYNMLSRLDGLRCCPLLETLTISHCKIESLESMEELFHLPELSTLDVSFNHIASVTGNSTDGNLVAAGSEHRDTIAQGADSPMIKFFQHTPAISVLYLHGNEVIRSLKDYRRNMVAHLPQLAYLDERPVFPEERRTTMAWVRGGVNAEGAERDAIREEKRRELSGCVDDMIQLRERTKDQREAKEKEWLEVRAAREKWEGDQRLEEVRWTTEIDHDEFEGRSNVEVEEMKVWGPLSSVVGSEYSVLARRHQQELEEQAAKVQAERELAEEEALVEAEAKAQRLDKEQERQLWLKKFTEEEDLYVDGMQDDLNHFLDQLTPATHKAATSTSQQPVHQQMLTMPTPTTTSNSIAESHRSQQQQRGGASTPPQEEEAVPPVPAPTRQKQQSLGGQQTKKNAVWEQYYAYEQAANRRFQN